jgi:hypothetical protein
MSAQYPPEIYKMACQVLKNLCQQDEEYAVIILEKRNNFLNLIKENADPEIKADAVDLTITLTQKFDFTTRKKISDYIFDYICDIIDNNFDLNNFSVLFERSLTLFYCLLKGNTDIK